MQRHIHMTPVVMRNISAAKNKRLGLHPAWIARRRPLTYDGVIIRVSVNRTSPSHIDTETNQRQQEAPPPRRERGCTPG